MAIPDARTEAYLNIFRNQHGAGGVPVFHGLSRYQSGQGLGDFFRSVLRRAIPVALGVGKAALSSFTGAAEEGRSLKDSLKAVVRPAIHAAALGTVEQLAQAQKEHAQTGKGRRRRRGGLKRKRVYKVKSHKRQKSISYNF